MGVFKKRKPFFGFLAPLFTLKQREGSFNVSNFRAAPLGYFTLTPPLFFFSPPPPPSSPLKNSGYAPDAILIHVIVVVKVNVPVQGYANYVKRRALAMFCKKSWQ